MIDLGLISSIDFMFVTIRDLISNRVPENPPVMACLRFPPNPTSNPRSDCPTAKFRYLAASRDLPPKKFPTTILASFPGGAKPGDHVSDQVDLSTAWSNWGLC
jgi:hypothetical protein